LTIDVQRVDFIRVPVKDIEEAKHFYGEVLGLDSASNRTRIRLLTIGSSTRSATSRSR
jgi:catechol-2,3-dioxygenase